VHLSRELQRIDWIPQLANQLTLLSLLADKQAAVRVAAVELIDSLRERRLVTAPHN
jgi:hypothetical protein